MTYLILSILSSTIILIVFKLFKRFGINTFQAIVFNYIVAFIVGFSLYGRSWSSAMLETGSWIPYVFIVGVLFISLFLLIGKSAQENGIGVTSVTVKMSLAIPVIFAIILYNEAVYLSKILGIIGALIGVYLITYQKKADKKKDGNVWFLIILFIGSGLLDTIINFVEKRALGELSPALFSAIGFGIAGLIGIVILTIAVFLKKQKLSLKNVVGGIILGIPNFYSIYFLIMAIRQPMDDSVTYALNNVGIVLASYIIGIFLFSESTSRIKLIGGAVAVVAIILLTT